MADSHKCVSRRRLMKTLGAAGATLAAAQIFGIANATGQEPSSQQPVPEFTGPGANPYWTSPGQLATYPQKAPLILLTDRPVQLETPAPIFSFDLHTQRRVFCPVASSDHSSNAVDLKEWRLHVEGNVERPLALSFPELVARFKSASVAAVNQCSGNSRSRSCNRGSRGGQWGNGAVGNAATGQE